MVQKRKTTTKEDIKEALIQLLSEEKFENISISKLWNAQGLIGELSIYTMKTNIKWLTVLKVKLFPSSTFF